MHTVVTPRILLWSRSYFLAPLLEDRRRKESRMGRMMRLVLLAAALILVCVAPALAEEGELGRWQGAAAAGDG